MDIDGVFSWWKGHTAITDRPDRFTLVTSATSSTRSVATRTRSMSSRR